MRKVIYDKVLINHTPYVLVTDKTYIKSEEPFMYIYLDENNNLTTKERATKTYVKEELLDQKVLILEENLIQIIQ